MKASLYNINGKKSTKKIELSKKVFEVEPNEHSIYLAVKSELAAKRQGTSSSKTRAEVRGGGSKPWKQKGTGRARVGSSRNPSRVHGGVVFGPKPHAYNLKVNKKEKNLARRSALSIKVSSKAFKVLENIKMDNPKTKMFLFLKKKPVGLLRLDEVNNKLNISFSVGHRFVGRSFVVEQMV